VAICATGNYFAGVLWPPALQFFIDSHGWRPTFIGAGIVCVLTIAPLSLLLRRRPQLAIETVAVPAGGDGSRPFGLSPGTVVTLLCIAGLGCCVAMAMPQIHLVAYCSQLGYTAKQGADVLSVLFIGGIISRLVSGAISDRIGGIRTIVLGSSLQGVALLLFLSSSDLGALFFFSGLFGIVQGGIVPAYAIIVREHFATARAGQNIATILMFSLAGMALGGLFAGIIFDHTGSYTAAFVHAFAWNLLNLSIVVFLLRRSRWRAVPVAA
jgi:MFS family permease